MDGTHCSRRLGEETSPMIRVTVIVDNKATQAGLATEHGLAFWIEYGPHRILFDTGAGLALRPNAERLGLDLGTASAIALSHGHYDHTGGLTEAWTAPERTPLYLHPAALTERYRVQADECKVLSMPRAAREQTAQHVAAVRYTTQPTEIAPNIWVTGHLAGRHRLEQANPEPFFLDPSGHQPDPLVDDQALYLLTAQGLVVLLGCAHAGVVTTLEHIRHRTGAIPLRALIGGLHLRMATPERLAWTISALQAHAPGLVAPLHCTGVAATQALAAAFGPQFCAAGAGSCFEFADAAPSPPVYPGQQPQSREP